MTRNAVSEDQIDLAAPYGIPTYIRDWGDTLSKSGEVALMEEIEAFKGSPALAAALAQGGTYDELVLLLSGGGPDGAFGAGF